ncbi:ABC transporter permease [Sellimonas sp.]|uniref:ABC transporter permease n=1 Tax=Sellimonas sp. TaxID=2021466 RepID=UPI00257F3DF0|nr:ABC transporter permease [Sellimonas sp.]
MEREERIRKRIRMIQMVNGIILTLPIFIMKFHIAGENLFFWSVIWKLIRERTFHPDYIIFFCVMIFTFLYLFRTIWLKKGKSGEWCFYLPKITLLMSCLAIPVFSQMMNPLPYLSFPLYYIVFSLLEFMIVLYLEQKDEIEEEYQKSKVQQKEEKEHLKRANYFPGKYSRNFYQVIRKNFRYHWKEQVVLTLAAILSAVCLYIVLAVYQMTEQIYGGKGDQSLLMGEGLYRLFRDLGMIVMILSILMMTIIISWYIKEQKKEFRLMVILGMRRHTSYRIFLVEYILNSLLALFIGIPIGMGGAALLRNQLEQGYQGNISLPPAVSLKQVGIGVLAYVILMILGLAFNQDNFLSLGRSTDRNEEIRKEKRLRERLGRWMAGGLFLYLVSMVWFGVRGWTETMGIYLLPILGTFFLLAGGLGLWLKRREKKEIYYRQLLTTVPFYHRFWRNTGVLFYMAALQFFILAVFSTPFLSSAMRQDIDGMYPYDIVCLSYEADMEEIQAVAEKYGGNAAVYPMVRMTSIYGSDKLYAWGGTRPVQWPQGQHIAISESSYLSLKEKAGYDVEPLGLTGEEMHVVYQQDLSVKTHTIDWDTSRLKKHLRFGQPLSYYNTGDYRNIYPERKIKSEERASLIGSFHQGMQENLIVLSDTYFDTVWKEMTKYNRDHWEERESADVKEWRMYPYAEEKNMTEGPTMLVCMELPEGKSRQAAEDLGYLREKYVFDQMWDRTIQPFYEKSQMMSNTESEIWFTRTAYGFILILLTVMAVFQYTVKIKEEENVWRWENAFLKQMGMKEKERKQRILWQMKVYLLIPLIAGSVGGVTFTALTVRARLFTVREVLQYMGTAGIFCAAYGLLWLLLYLLHKRNVWRYVEKEK